MEHAHLSTTVSIKTVSEDGEQGVFEVQGLYGGYGLTLGNALRRVLLSSLPGAATTQVKIKNVSHEFSTLPGMKEDIVEFCLNFKKLRLRMHVNEPRVLSLKAKGQTTVTAADITTDDQVEIINPDLTLATLTAKNAELDVEITVERGLGYSAVEARRAEKLPIGVIAVDALFSPVVNVNYSVENMRVGERTDFNRLRIEIQTNGAISPSSALHKATVVLRDHFDKVAGVDVKEFELPKTASPKGSKKISKSKK
ncbi:MAG: DNA-directed RNA polymerase subunit alpha [Candidatus Liptonbacteria bacterium]|nr:DNA-directed RNA polymerase subunit alpha [Candidatus Liptonbacteria bacterium]